MEDIQIKSWRITLCKPTFPSNHKYFCFNNPKLEKDKTWENNVLEQERRIKIGNYQLTIQRKREFKDVDNIQHFLDRRDSRIGNWN